jgi:hypothetical protein
MKTTNTTNKILKQLFCIHVYKLHNSEYSHTYKYENFDELFSGYTADIEVHIDTFECVKCKKLHYTKRKVTKNERHY